MSTLSDRKPIDRGAAIKKIGQMMVDNWRMMAISCPICHTCLMQKQEKEGVQIYCPGCDLPVKVQGPSQTAPSQSSSSSSLSEAQSNLNHVDVANTDDLSDNDNEKGSFGSGAAAGGNATSVIPPRPPTTSSDKKNSDSSKSIDDSILSSASEKVLPIGREPSLEEAKKEYDRKNKQKDQISSKIGSYMLRGWALMDKTCCNNSHPNADSKADAILCSLCVNTPLMRSKDKIVFVCVCCGEESQVATYDELSELRRSEQEKALTQSQEITTSNSINNSKIDASGRNNRDSTDKQAKNSDSSTIAASKASPSDIKNKQTNLIAADDLAGDNMDEEFYLDEESLDIVQRSSALIGTALLEGWRILSDICPRPGCNVPLVACTASNNLKSSSGEFEMRVCVLCDDMDAKKLRAKGQPIRTITTIATKGSSNSNSNSNISNDNNGNGKTGGKSKLSDNFLGKSHSESDDGENDDGDDDDSSDSTIHSSSTSSSTTSSSSSSSFSSTSSSVASEEQRFSNVAHKKNYGSFVRNSYQTSTATATGGGSKKFDISHYPNTSASFRSGVGKNGSKDSKTQSLQSHVLDTLYSQLKRYSDSLEDPSTSPFEAVKIAKLVKHVADAIRSTRHMLD